MSESSVMVFGFSFWVLIGTIPLHMYTKYKYGSEKKKYINIVEIFSLIFIFKKITDKKQYKGTIRSFKSK